MKKRLSSFLIKEKKFRNESRRQLRMLVVVTLGFTIAFSWRQTIFDLSQSFVNFILHLEGSSTSSILTSIFITLISILLIYLTAYYLRDNKEH